MDWFELSISFSSNFLSRIYILLIVALANFAQVSVSAVDQATGQTHSIAIEPCGGLSPAQIEWMVQEAQRNTATDALQRQRVEASTQAVVVVEDVLSCAQRFAAQLGPQRVARMEVLVQVRAYILSQYLSLRTDTALLLLLLLLLCSQRSSPYQELRAVLKDDAASAAAIRAKAQATHKETLELINVSRVSSPPV